MSDKWEHIEDFDVVSGMDSALEPKPLSEPVKKLLSRLFHGIFEFSFRVGRLLPRDIEVA